MTDAPPARSQLSTAAALARQSASGGQNPAVSVYQQNGASIVNITSLAVVRNPSRPGRAPRGIGSGFIIDTDRRIVTNNHVVQDVGQLAVTFQDKTTIGHAGRPVIPTMTWL